MPELTEASIRELAGFRSSDHPVVSCYLDVDGRRQVRAKDYQLTLDSMARRVAVEHAEFDLGPDLQRLTRHVGKGIDRHGVRGLAMFSCASKGLWEVVPLPVPVASRIAINQSPMIGPLEAIVRDLEPLAVLLVDRQRARLFRLHFGEVIERSNLFEALPRDYDRRDDAGRGSREREQHHVDELAMQHLRHAADAVFRLHQETGFGHLTVGATDDVFAAFEPLLHPYVRERMAPRLHIAVTASESEIVRAALEVERQVERTRETALVGRLRDAIGSSSRGVAGLAPVLHALGEKRVATLLVSNGYVESGWQCACGALARKGPTCPVDGATMQRTDDVVSDAIDAALLEGARIEMCEGNADLDVLGRIGALLRY